MSLRLRLLNRWLRLTERPALQRAQDPDKLRRGFERKARLFFHPPRGTRCEAQDLDGAKMLQVTPRSTDPAAPVTLYFHGGAYVFGSPKTHRAMLARLCAMTGGMALLPRYRRAPEHPFPAALEDALAAYRAVAARHGPPVIGGDSAGGGLALALLGRILQEGLPRPLGCFGFSPLTDLTFSGASVKTQASRDVVLPADRVDEMAQMYLQGAEPADPGASPLFADFHNAPPVWLTAGDTEILLDDTRRMAAHLRAQGVQVAERIVPDHPHVWPIFHNILPEARSTLRELADWSRDLSR